MRYNWTEKSLIYRKIAAGPFHIWHFYSLKFSKKNSISVVFMPYAVFMPKNFHLITKNKKSYGLMRVDLYNPTRSSANFHAVISVFVIIFFNEIVL